MPPRNMLRTDTLDYDLPDGRIATRPAEPRDSARMLVVSRSDPARTDHLRVRDLPGLLAPGDAMVFNVTSVLPARVSGRRRDTGGAVGGLFLEALPGAFSDRGFTGVWRILLRSGGRLRPGYTIDLADARGLEAGVSLVLIEPAPDQPGAWLAGVQGDRAFPDAARTLDALGAAPLPPYILQARKHAGDDTPDERDRDWYRTVYADSSTLDEHGGSVAAPTAGMHFTPELLDAIDSRGVARSRVVLHVGAGTFKPVDTEFVEQHPMHSERIHVPAQTLAAIDTARAAGARSIAVGTTTARALESVPPGHSADYTGATSLLITPGYAFRRVDALLTNFHLPRSTLLAMVAALFPRGVDDLMPIYREAVREGYRFYSYGDAMLVLP